jgi:hypothetical protein
VDLGRAPVVGDIVVAVHPLIEGEIVKRLTRIDPDGYWLEGAAMRIETAASSKDSWVVGSFTREQILGVVLRRQ